MPMMSSIHMQMAAVDRQIYRFVRRSKLMMHLATYQYRNSFYLILSAGRNIAAEAFSMRGSWRKGLFEYNFTAEDGRTQRSLCNLCVLFSLRFNNLLFSNPIAIW